MTEESEAPPTAFELSETAQEAKAADEHRRNRWENTRNDARVWLLSWSSVCAVILVVALSTVIVITLAFVTIDHTFNDEILSKDQMERIRSTMIGIRDWLAGSAFLSTALLFWLAKRGWIMPADRSDDTTAG